MIEATATGSDRGAPSFGLLVGAVFLPLVLSAQLIFDSFREEKPKEANGPDEAKEKEKEEVKEKDKDKDKEGVEEVEEKNVKEEGRNRAAAPRGDPPRSCDGPFRPPDRRPGGGAPPIHRRCC